MLAGPEKEKPAYQRVLAGLADAALKYRRPQPIVSH